MSQEAIKSKLGLALLALMAILLGWLFLVGGSGETVSSGELKLYWFIPDGLRAEPDVFTIYKWAEEGELPNLKKLMEKGAYGYSIPDFPSHTPVNFATLLTGSHPTTHLVADGPMRIEGYPLEIVSMSGFRSNAKKVPPMWFTLEKEGFFSFLLSMPGSTPPELSRGITVRGRWGGWGADFHAINFQDQELELPVSDEARASKLFYFGADLHKETKTTTAVNWKEAPVSYSSPTETVLTGWDASVYAYIYDSTDDQKINYDRVAFSFDKEGIFVDLPSGEWSEWLPVTLKWQTRNDYNLYTPKKLGVERKYSALDIDTDFKIKVIKLENDGVFRIRFLYNNLNEFITKPETVAYDLTSNVGPMVDFVDNFPPQLIYYEEDKETFLEEAEMSFEWHREAVAYILDTYKPEAMFHNIYTPNQMLTSRWWLGFVDPKSDRYEDVTDKERDMVWDEIKWMYKQVDAILGEVMERADENTIIVFSSDHGVAALNKEVYINNLFAQKGLLEYTVDPVTSIPLIDWDNTKAVFLRMDNIYIDPDGLGGNWRRAKGERYEKTRNEVISLLRSIEDENGTNPFSAIVKWEDVGDFLMLPESRVGDLVIANEVGYHWNEEITEDGKLFSVPLKSGYKQAILPRDEKSVWTPFVIAGPGVRKGVQLSEPISHVDQYPTIMTLLGEDIPDFVEGRVLDEIFE